MTGKTIEAITPLDCARVVVEIAAAGNVDLQLRSEGHCRTLRLPDGRTATLPDQGVTVRVFPNVIEVGCTRAFARSQGIESYIVSGAPDKTTEV